MKVRDLPGWPPAWTVTTGGPRPVGLVGVLRSIDWRVDLTGARDLRITVEYQGHLWAGLYPDSAEARTQLDALGGDAMLERLHQMLGQYAGETMTRVSDLELPRTA